MPEVGSVLKRLGWRGRCRACNGLSVGLLAITSFLATSAPAAAELYRYRVTWGDLPVLEAEVSLERAAGRYAVRGQGETVGPAAWFFPWRGQASSEGTVAVDGILPVRHESSGVVRGSDRVSRLAWRSPGAAPDVTVLPPPDLADVTPVPPNSTAGTIDPFTALVRVLDSLASTGRCQGRERVWDGRRRYDLVIEDAGSRVFDAESAGSYAGPAVGCRLIYERIGGFNRDSPLDSDQRMPPRLVWVADLPGHGWVPVQIELSTRIGAVVGRLQM